MNHIPVLKTFVQNELDLEVAGWIKPLPASISPAPEFLQRTRQRLLGLETELVAGTGRAA